MADCEISTFSDSVNSRISKGTYGEIHHSDFVQVRGAKCLTFPFMPIRFDVFERPVIAWSGSPPYEPSKL